jgi:peptide methionine sulfoxide reductase msrA/msrB
LERVAMHRIRHPSKRSSHLTLWLGLVAAIVVLAGFLHYSSILAEKKRAGNYNYLKPVPSESMLHARLKDEQYRVTREGATETAFRNEYWNTYRPGLYVDVITNDPLFSSLDKYDSGTGRPTFTKPISPDATFQQPDNSQGMNRTEVRAKLSNSHLGHVFQDATSPSGVRYAINSAALRFVPLEQMEDQGYSEYLAPLKKKSD